MRPIRRSTICRWRSTRRLIPPERRTQIPISRRDLFLPILSSVMTNVRKSKERTLVMKTSGCCLSIDMSNKEITTLLGKMWKELPEEEKQEYEKQHAEEKKAYEEKMGEYRREHPELKEKTPKKQKETKSTIKKVSSEEEEVDTNEEESENIFENESD